MRIALHSDLHFEHYTAKADILRFIKALDLTDTDVCVLAGDIAQGPSLLQGVLTAFTTEHPDVDFVFVPGNHDFWGTDADTLWAMLDALEAHHPRLHCPNADQPLQLHGRQWHGHTGWYPDTPDAVANARHWPDFQFIGGAYDLIYAERLRWAQYLRFHCSPGDIVVSHMLPSYAGITPRWRGTASNAFFVSDLDDIITNAAPALWLHGHTHDSLDIQLGTTRVVCNPHGYPSTPNPDRQPSLRITL